MIMTSFPRIARLVSLASALALLAAAPVAAQDVTSAPAAPVTIESAAVPAASGPAMDAASVGVKAISATAAAPAAAAAPSGQSTALMIVGGAAVLTGIVIGNDAGYAISVVGAVIGLYGLYKYLQ